MQRTNIYLTEEQQTRIHRRAQEEGMSKSMLIRRILDEALPFIQTTASVEEAIKNSSGIWADRDAAELDGVLAWRREAHPPEVDPVKLFDTDVLFEHLKGNSAATDMVLEASDTIHSGNRTEPSQESNANR